MIQISYEQSSRPCLHVIILYILQTQIQQANLKHLIYQQKLLDKYLNNVQACNCILYNKLFPTMQLTLNKRYKAT